jgi:hypothetical protein
MDALIRAGSARRWPAAQRPPPAGRKAGPRRAPGARRQPVHLAPDERHADGAARGAVCARRHRVGRKAAPLRCLRPGSQDLRRTRSHGERVPGQQRRPLRRDRRWAAPTRPTRKPGACPWRRCADQEQPGPARRPAWYAHHRAGCGLWPGPPAAHSRLCLKEKKLDRAAQALRASLEGGPMTYTALMEERGSKHPMGSRGISEPPARRMVLIRRDGGLE